MTEKTCFPVELSVIEKALKKGIKVKDGKDELNQVQGVTTLMWHPSLRRWCLAYGSDPKTAGFVLLEDYGKYWTTE